jgi:hypothetical protein
LEEKGGFMDLTSLSKEELLAELTRREEVEKALAYNKRLAKWDRISANRTAVLDLLEHSRTSCSDANTCNSYPNSEGYPRCVRCFLLDRDLAETHFSPAYMAENYNVEFSIRLEPVKEK